MGISIQEGSVHQPGAGFGTPVMGVSLDGTYRPMSLAGLEPDEFSVDELNVPAAGTAAIITLPARGVDLANVISGVAFSYASAPTGGGLTIADGDDTVFSLDVTAAGLQVIEFDPPRKGKPNRAMVITVADGGAMQMKLNLLSSWIVFSPLNGQFNFNDADQSDLIPFFF